MENTGIDTSSPNPAAATVRFGKRPKKTALFAATSVLIIVGLAAWQIYKLRRDISELQWSNAIAERRDDSEITADVGTIQFMKKGGYSIQLNSANYTADGLHLAGTVGNPTRLTITNLALKFTATKQLYQYQDEFDKYPFVMFLGPPPIGTAQCSPISYLGSGITAPFEITIPNVKQTKEGVRLVVEFTGERYSY